VAKAYGLKPRPSLLYLAAQISGRDLSCLIDTGATYSFMNPKLAKELGLRVQKASKPINMRFAKGKLHKIKKVVLDVTLECEKLEF
jgi:predicted aspartyl protease